MAEELNPEISALTGVSDVPVTGLCAAVTLVPYAVVSPYSKETTVEELLAFTVPFNVAVVSVTVVAGFVTAVGG